MKVKPIGDRVLLSTEQTEEKTQGGLFIPQTAQEKTQTGVVVAVGDDKDAITVKKGDKVMHLLYNSIDWLIAYFGIVKTGA